MTLWTLHSRFDPLDPPQRLLEEAPFVQASIPCFATTNALQDKRRVLHEVDVATCSCGFEMGKRGCEDIDECRETFLCPAQSSCSNTVGNYECKCIAGFMNPITRGFAIPKEDPACVLGTLFNVSNIEFNSFSSGIFSINVTAANVSFTLFSIASEAGDLEVEVKIHTRILNFTRGLIANPVSPNISKILLLDALTPGTQYKMLIQTPKVFISPIIITKCYCEKVAGDDSGMPKVAFASQDNGFVTFTFQDNSRCEEAYSFSQTSIEPINSLIQNAVVFTPDFYSFSLQEECASDPYTPGLQLSNLNVGQTYLGVTATQP